uniref:CSON004796 protein n=1 Tax=Culicoides sonorensis TaxID=179676 RepID=A0A336LZB6_CULSO
MYSKKSFYAIILIVMCLTSITLARSYKNSNKRQHKHEKPKQIYNTRETNGPNFFRLLLMRFVYGLAAQMGAEERVADVFGGALVPPNADDDYFDLGLESDEIEDVMGFF